MYNNNRQEEAVALASAFLFVFRTSEEVRRDQPPKAIERLWTKIFILFGGI
jgi:hypothetical protein